MSDTYGEAHGDKKMKNNHVERGGGLQKHFPAQPKPMKKKNKEEQISPIQAGRPALTTRPG